MTTLTEPQCPHCGSHHVRTAAAVYAAGTQSVNLLNKGVGLGISQHGGLGVGVTRGRSRGTAISLEAQRAAPATAGIMNVWASLFAWIALAIVLKTGGVHDGFLTSLFLVGALNLGIFFWSYYRAEELNADYERRWMCSACGGMFLR
jgi:hypothetical protein